MYSWWGFGWCAAFMSMYSWWGFGWCAQQSFSKKSFTFGTLSCTRTSPAVLEAPFFSRNAIMSSCLMFLAQCQGVSPALLLAFTLAPKLSKSCAPSIQPIYAQLCKGVFPAASTSFTFTPPSTAFLMAFTSLLLTARWITMSPTFPCAYVEPPPSSFTPTGPCHSGKGPSTRVYHGSFSILVLTGSGKRGSLLFNRRLCQEDCSQHNESALQLKRSLS